jgi:RimJ/RimL family protein N-acetyltransferase
MAIAPTRKKAQVSSVRLMPFQREHAALVASWVMDAREAYFLAPRTPPPVTANKVRGWGGPGQRQFVLMEAGRQLAVAYGELNVLRTDQRRFWLGHLIVDPQQRGHGLGTELTRLLLRHAFTRLGATQVTLVVFPENRPAVVCYRAAGMHESGSEWHYFPPYERHVRLLRMDKTAGG